MITIIEELKNLKLIKLPSFLFAKFINEKQQPFNYDQETQDLTVLISALTNEYALNGSSCLSFEAVDNLINLQKNDLMIPLEIAQRIKNKSIRCNDYKTLLKDHIAFSDDFHKVSPLKFFENNIFLHRYLKAEINIAHYLKEQTSNNKVFDPSILSDQQSAIDSTLENKFTLISGGPGTGKTTTVLNILAKLISSEKNLNITLAAPTGKAAARLKESIEKGISNPHFKEQFSDEIIAHIPRDSQTIHLLLGINPFKEQAKYNKDNPLNTDVLVLDEISMIDIFLMNKLIDALKPDTKVIMLGDKDQLSSVESGSIISELCLLLDETSGKKLPKIRSSICHLSKSYRFKEDSGIKLLSEKVNQQQSDIDNLFIKQNDLHHCNNHLNTIAKTSFNLYQDFFTAVKNNANIKDIFTAFNKARVLTVLNEGTTGAKYLNNFLGEHFKKQNALNFRNINQSFEGKAVLITENDRNLNIFNGDVGIMLKNSDGNLRVYFENGITLIPSLLPPHELAFAMTTHKSQGSEFDHSILVMPNLLCPILKKELIYTAVTRAKKEFTLLGDLNLFKEAIKEKTNRNSALLSLLSSDLI